MKTCIISQFYIRPEILERDTPAMYPWFWDAWEKGLDLYAPQTPVLVVNNGWPNPSPYRHTGWIDNPYLRLQDGHIEAHRDNWWTAIRTGLEQCQTEGYDLAVFISQHLLVGTTFVEYCAQEIAGCDMLFNRGCLGEHNYYTEYFACRPEAGLRVFQRDPMTLPELVFPYVMLALDLKVQPFPRLRHSRDAVLLQEDTFSFHCKPEEFRRFADEKIYNGANNEYADRPLQLP